jgi:hypothetical protein
MIYVKLHPTDNGIMVAMCDSKLIDKILSEGEIEINLKDYSDFYKGALLGKEAALALIKKDDIYSANIVGDESIKIALEKGIIEKGHLKKIEKVPYANAFRLV